MAEPPVCDKCNEPIIDEEPVYLLRSGPLHDRCATEAMTEFLKLLHRVAQNEERPEEKPDDTDS